MIVISSKIVHVCLISLELKYFRLFLNFVSRFSELIKGLISKHWRVLVNFSII